MPSVEFKFHIDQKVKTPFGDIGIIESQAYDFGYVNYYVHCATFGTWFKEKDLTPNEV